MPARCCRDAYQIILNRFGHVYTLHSLLQARQFTVLQNWRERLSFGFVIADGRLLDQFPGHQATATSFDTGAWLLYPSRAFLPAKVRLAIDFLRRQLART